MSVTNNGQNLRCDDCEMSVERKDAHIEQTAFEEKDGADEWSVMCPTCKAWNDDHEDEADDAMAETDEETT